MQIISASCLFRPLAVLGFLGLLLSGHLIGQTTIDLDFPRAKIVAALKQHQDLPMLSVQFTLEETELAPQAYKIEVWGNEVRVQGGDERGLLYGGLEVAEQLELHGKVENTEGAAFLAKRGIKFNIPLDARTPGYDDTGDAAQRNIAEMWNWAFWEEFLDDMALHRYNVLTVWSPHPFPSMIKMEAYPDVALDDVMVTSLEPIGVENEWGEPQLVSSNVLENLTVVKKMTIDEKIALWQRIMAYAKKRGIDVYFITWNICLNGVAKAVPPYYRTYGVDPYDEPPGKYGVSHQVDDPETITYLREAVKTFLLTYPDLKGIGVTAGEHMPPRTLEKFDREKWLWDTYGEGILDAKKEQTGRTVEFIHRVWNSDMKAIMKHWDAYPDPFDVSFKYAKARLYASPNVPFADQHIEDMKPYGLKSWWNLRNDDIFVYRWGDSEYVRSFLKNFPQEHTAAYQMGSDGYVWGREFVAKDKALAGELEIKKHWYNFLLWGRLGYDNSLDKNFFVDKLGHHFPDLPAELLHDTWQSASEIVPQVNRFYWKDWDHMWSVESCYSMREGFQTVIDFMDNPTMKKSNIINPAAYVERVDKEGIVDAITPLQVAETLSAAAANSLEGVSVLGAKGELSAEARVLLDDLSAMACLGQYYAAKIEAATELALFKAGGEQEHKRQAVSLLVEAMKYWTAYAEVSERNYHPQSLARTRRLDWKLILNDVKADIGLAQSFGRN